MTKKIRVALLGLGTVGGGVVQLLTQNKSEIGRRLDVDLEIVAGASLHPVDGLDFPQTTDYMSLTTKEDVDVVIELMGGTTHAHEAIKSALNAGKHVITANKALIAKEGNALFALARDKGVLLGYEASVAGGIPIIKTLKTSLQANQIHRILGIINGTGNYILTQMSEAGTDFDAALKEAQALGYAEADPTFDIEGIDAAHKLAILGANAFGTPIDFDSVQIEGITNLTPQDITYAKELGYVVKHLGVAKRRAQGIELRVHPTLIQEDALLAKVNGVKNAVLVDASPLGQTLYYGDGAGAGATASAVVSDLMDVVNASASGPALGFTEQNALPVVETESGYYLRLNAPDKAGTLAKITRILTEADISIDALLQHKAQHQTPIVLLTRVIKESQLNQALDALQEYGHITCIRIEDLTHLAP